MCYLPNGIIIIWYKWISNYEGFLKVEQASIMGQNKKGNADMSEVLKLWEGGIKKNEPLHESVYINTLFLHIHYMDKNAVIPKVGKTHDRIVCGLDRRFLFQCDDVDLKSIEGYITMLWNIQKINKYSGWKWLWLGEYETSGHWDRGTLHLMNLLFISWMQ